MNAKIGAERSIVNVQCDRILSGAFQPGHVGEEVLHFRADTLQFAAVHRG